MYTIQFASPSLPYTQKQTPIVIPSSSIITNALSLKFTGKGAANYGAIQQENFVRLLENFASGTSPNYPTVGQTWYDTTVGSLKVCSSTAPYPVRWDSLKSTQITDIGLPPPVEPVLGDTWYQRTGPQAGFLYVYTGIGRYPEKNWNSTAINYFPSTSSTATALLNKSNFTTTDYNEIYLCALVSGTPTDADFNIIKDGSAILLPKGSLNTSQSVLNGYIMRDLVNNTVYVLVKQLPDGTWCYDTAPNGTATWAAFTPLPAHYIIGTCTILEQDDNTAPGVSSATVWSEAVQISKIKYVQPTENLGSIGGWEQVHPAVQAHGSREDYDYMLGLLSQLVGDEDVYGGNGALQKSIDYLSPMLTLDASLEKALTDKTADDLGRALNLSSVQVQPNSNDWDKLLTAAKYAVNRLELPAQYTTSISDVPFVYDGRLSPIALSSKGGLYYPSDRRLQNDPLGSIQASRLYQETINVLNNAIQNKHVLKGMLGTSGTNATFSSGVGIVPHVNFTANVSGTALTAGVNHAVLFNFASTKKEAAQFFKAGQAIEIILQYNQIADTASDINLQELCNRYGRIRITENKTFVMGNTNTPALAVAPQNAGIWPYSTVPTQLVSLSYGDASCTVSCTSVFLNNAFVGVRINALLTAGELTGNLGVNWNRIEDAEMNTSVRVFPSPVAFTGADKTGSVLFV